MSLRRAVLLFGLVVLVFDGLWVTLPRIPGVRWTGSGFLSIILTVTIYLLAGMMAGRHGSISDAATAGVVVAAIDATAGGVLAALIGGTSLASVSFWAVIVVSAVVAIVLGTVFGTIGGAIARLPGIAPRLESDDIPL